MKIDTQEEHPMITEAEMAMIQLKAKMALISHLLVRGHG